MANRTFSMGGIHPHDSKISKDCQVEQFPLPEVVYIPLAQHIGAPSKALVAVGDKVKVGQPIAEPFGFVSSFIHSSVSGTVKSIGTRKDISGREQQCIEIKVEGDEWLEGIDRSEDLVTEIPDDPKTVLDKIRLAGIVGLGGATFPAHVKLSLPPGKKCETLIINGCECEPYLTSDYRAMLEKGEQMVVGTALIKHVLGVDKAVIGIEDNKPEAIRHITEIVKNFAAKSDKYKGISVMSLMKKYPEGGEKQLISAVMKREVKSGGLPIDVGAVVQNVATAIAVYDAVHKNKPIVDKVVTITGECAPRQANLLVRIGTPLQNIIDYIGGIPEDAVKIVSGGPMMGKAISNLEASAVKGTSSLLFLTAAQTKRKPESPCIRCAKCAESCPMGLEPFLLNKLAKNNMMEELEHNAVQDCIECGCCIYSCPANIPLLDRIRQAKMEVMGIIRGRKAAEAKPAPLGK